MEKSNTNITLISLIGAISTLSLFFVNFRTVVKNVQKFQRFRNLKIFRERAQYVQEKCREIEVRVLRMAKPYFFLNLSLTLKIKFDTYSL